MICPACQGETPDDSKFCENCGFDFSPKTTTVAPPEVKEEHHFCMEFDEEGFCVECGKMKLAQQPEQKVIKETNNLAMVSSIGLRHHENQDAGMVAAFGRVIMAVADGVSTSVDSDKASALTVDEFRRLMVKAPVCDEATVKAALIEIDKDLREIPFIPKNGYDRPECTVVAAVVTGNTAVIGWVGDSRIFAISPTGERQLTIDDSWMEMVVRAGQMSRAEAETNRLAHAVTQIMGMDIEVGASPIDFHVATVELAEDESLLLCTDGVWNYFYDGELAKYINAKKGSTAVEICQSLVDTANLCGGQDNITAALYLRGSMAA